MTETIRYSEQDFYVAAADFSDSAAQLAQTADPSAVIAALKELRDLFNRNCVFRGRDIRVSSAAHHVDWSNGETNQWAIDLPKETGDFTGCFIGYADLPPNADQNNVPAMSMLAVVMRTNILIPDLAHYAEVLMVTPIAGSDIAFV